ncbi:hypothetical protein ACJIZ3_011748 [Penstemon smallii]|uniref:Uncharacterized protein n=1 Tax=Penstemon smallii TaxID=265156 RepID=A0ABD3ULM9_9LAMI
MATSVESPSSPVSLTKVTSPMLKMGSCSPPLFSPSSDKRFWSTLRSRIETHIENRKPAVDLTFPTQMKGEVMEGKNRLKEDSMLLLRGFDSVAHSLSQLSNNLDNALQGARDLSRPPTLTDIVHATLEKAKTEEKTLQQQQEDDIEEEKRGSKRKLDSDGEEDSQELGNIKKAKNLAISMATKAANLARELKSIRSDLSFMQDRCALLEEENKNLRQGLPEPEEDDLVRLQLEALLAEKSRLANENANLTRENQCLNQLLEYHQLNSQDLSASYENLLKGMCLDFSSPSENGDGFDTGIQRTLKGEDISGFCKSLDECYAEEQD